MKTREENRMVKVDILFKTTLFGHILKKIQHNHFFLGAWVIPLGPYSVYTWFGGGEGVKAL